MAGAATGLAAGSPPARVAASHAFRIGELEVVVLSDGNLEIPAANLATNAERGQLATALAAAGQTVEQVAPPCNVTLIRMRSGVVLIDVGAGARFMPTAGKLLASMEAGGIARESITTVVFTHAHPDHLWGTLDDFDDQPSFPNASYVISSAEWDFWLADDVLRRLPEERQNFAAGARRNLARIEHKVRTVEPVGEIVAGLRALDTAGHTAGHISVEVATGRDGLIVLGDALTRPVVSFAHPDWKPAADHHDPDLAVRTRRSLLDRLAADRTPIIGYHLPWPGLGHVASKGTAFAFEPRG